jgi:acyl dehydratase
VCPDILTSLFYDDFQVGQVFRSKEKKLSQREVDRFARLTGDMNPLHINAKFASTTVFRGRIVHGMLVLSLALGLWYGENITRQSIIALIGINNVSFKKAVYPNNRLHLVSKVLAKRLSSSRPDVGIVTFSDQIQNEGGVVVAEAERVLLLKRKKKARK